MNLSSFTCFLRLSRGLFQCNRAASWSQGVIVRNENVYFRAPRGEALERRKILGAPCQAPRPSDRRPYPLVLREIAGGRQGAADGVHTLHVRRWKERRISWRSVLGQHRGLCCGWMLRWAGALQTTCNHLYKSGNSRCGSGRTADGTAAEARWQRTTVRCGWEQGMCWVLEPIMTLPE